MSTSYTKLIESPCRFDAVREAARALRTFLSSHGASREDLDSWELLIVEAGNNCVEHATEEAKQKNVRFLLNTWPEAVELTITDYSRGFAWPDNVDLPGQDSEHGRGLFLIEALADSVRYVRGETENFLILRKNRPMTTAPTHRSDDDVEKLLESMTAELASSYESLSAIFRLTSDITGKELTVEGVGIWLRELVRIVSADWFVLRLVSNGHQSLQTFAASKGLVFPDVILSKTSTDVEASAISKHDVGWFGYNAPLSDSDPLTTAISSTASGVVHPIFVGEEAVGTLTLGLVTGEAAFTSGQLSVIRTCAHFLGMRMRNTRAQNEALQAKVVSRELQVAAGIQQSLFPKSLPKIPGIQLAAHSQSVREVGGDFFDAIQFGNEGLLLVIADVMGKGVPAALFAAIFRSQVRSRLDLASRPGDLMAWLNRSLFSDLDGVDMFITAQLVYIDTSARTLKVATAGHNPLYLIAGDGSTLVESTGGASPIGIAEAPRYREESFSFDGRARLLLYTDGVVESRNSLGVMLGARAVADWFQDTAAEQLDADATATSLKKVLTTFRGDTPASDDVTFLVLVEKS